MKAMEAPPHAPRGGTIQKLLGPFYVTGVFWFRFHRWGVAASPSWLTPLLVEAFSAFFWIALRRVRRAIAQNLEAALGPCGFRERERRVYRTIKTFAWCLTERYENLNGAPGFRWSEEGIEHWNALAGRPGGFILLTGHLGNWEVGSMIPSGTENRTVHVVREGEMDPKAQAFIRELLSKRADAPYVTHFAGEDASLGIALLEALRAGDIVALQGDRPRSKGRTHKATMFGRPFDLPAGPSALARAADVPMLPVFTLRTGRREYRIVFRPAVVVDAGVERQEAFRQASQAIATTMEELIRREPYQWFCFRELW